MTGQPLYMLQLPLDSRRVAAFATAHGLAADISKADSGYVAHALLTALFGPLLAPKPFVLQQRPDGGAAVDLLAYSGTPLATLMAQAQLTAAPMAFAAVIWGDAAEKPMPALLPEGLVLAFQVRACPTIRLARGAQAKAPGSEIDAFLAALDRRDADADEIRLDRELVYKDWLRVRIPGADLTELRLEAFRHIHLSRRTAPAGEDRPLKIFRKPDALFSGRLRVADGQLLMANLIRGIGRHRAFGFGMLLLRPVSYK